MSIAPKPAWVCLPALPHPPSTIFGYLCGRFSQIGEDVWLSRIANGNVRTVGGAVITETTPYRPGINVSYYREVAAEAAIPFQEEIIFQNEHLLVADKPHFLPVTPAGQAVNECLLYRLQKSTGIGDLAPLHRLDRETAGLVLFSIIKAERSIYAQLFAEQNILKEYEALAAIADRPRSSATREWVVETRIEAGDPWFTMRVAPGAPNASTGIRLVRVDAGLGHFELTPQTGKKHQLRVHMMSIGFPFRNYPFYPRVRHKPPGDFSRPLQLLAKHISFFDPITRTTLDFHSRHKLGHSSAS